MTEKRGQIIRQKYITREEVRARRNDRLYVFGDNMVREGLGGQAGAMRGEPNTLGVPTKWKPTRSPSAYFSDSDWDYIGVRLSIQNAFDSIEKFLKNGFDVVIPLDGLGTGLSELPERAPKIHREIENLIADLENTYGNKE